MSGGHRVRVRSRDGCFHARCNRTMVDLEPLSEREDVDLVVRLIQRHVRYTNSKLAAKILEAWEVVRVGVREGHADAITSACSWPNGARARENREAGLRRAGGGRVGKATRLHRNPARTSSRYAPSRERLRDWREVYLPYPAQELRDQGARCMDCSIPFCHQGCPLGNLIPDWNDLVYRDRWRDAIDRLHETNNFPEFTGRLCPAPCEGSCVLAINNDAGDDQVDRERHHRARVRRRVDYGPAAGQANGQARGGGRLRARRAWRPPISSTARATW